MSQLQSPARPPDQDLDDDDRLIGRVLSPARGAGAARVPAAWPSTIAACALRVRAAPPRPPRAAPPPRPRRPAPTRPPRRRDRRRRCRRASSSRADRRPVLRRREPRALRHPADTGDGVGLRRRRRSTLGWVVSQVDGDACLPLEGVHRRRVALRRARRLLRTCRAASRATDFLRGFQRTDAGQAPDHHGLPGLVPGSRGPHPLQDPHRPGRRQPASSSRRSCSSTTPSASRSTRRASTPRRASRTSRTRATGSSTRAAGRRLLDVDPGRRHATRPRSRSRSSCA